MTAIALSSATPLASDAEIAVGCLPQTLIRMADGSGRPIGEIRPEEHVVTADGRTGVVRQTVTRRENDSLVRVTLSGRTPVYLAPGHILLTENGDVAARDLMLGEQVALTRFLPPARAALDTGKLISPRERALNGGAWHDGGFGEPKRLVTPAPIPDIIPLTPRKGRLFGLFLAYGSGDATKVRWTFREQQRDALVVECADLLSDLGIDAEIQPQLNGRVSVIVYGAAWARLWTRLFGARGISRTLHPLLFGDADYLRAMLGGWVAGEGYGGRNIADRWQRMRGSTMSRTLAMTVADIALGLGFRPAIRCCAPRDNLYSQRSRSFYEVDLVEPCGDSDDSAKGDHRERSADERPVVNAAHAWSRVRGVEQCRFSGPVYSLNVDGDESYVAEGIGVRCSVSRGACVAENR